MRKPLLIITLATLFSFVALSAATPATAATSAIAKQTNLPDTLVIKGPPPEAVTGGTYEPPTDELSVGQRVAIDSVLQHNLRALQLDGRIAPATAERVALIFPLRAARTLNDFGFHGLSNLVDHNAAFPGQVLDYYCYGRTYDTAAGYNHTGTDFFSWPFGWRKMDEGQVEVVAAAPGTIIAKQDGQADRSCALSNAQWNAVYVRHSDGSMAWYGHLKRNSLTQKPVGATVAAGEYLGIVGSSGSSTGPHLHFELRDAGGAVIDPFFEGGSGHSCNASTSTSWWTAQPPFYDPAINKITTGLAEPLFNTCPAPETPNIADDFALQPAGTTVFFTVYYRDLLGAQQTLYSLYAPDGTLYSQWRHISPGGYSATYFTYNVRFPDTVQAGTWRLAVDFQGQSYGAYFNLNSPITINVTSPTSGDTWPAGIAREIRWTDTLGGNVRVELWRGGTYVATIARSVPSNGVAGYMMPVEMCSSGDFRIRIYNEANPGTFAESNSFSVSGHCVYVPMSMRG